jgi:hypothetical protein
MSSSTSLSIRDKVEACALAWVAFKIAEHVVATPADASLWSAVDLKRRKELLDRRYPRVVFDASEAPEDEAVEGLYRVTLEVYLGTSGDELPVPAGFVDLATVHQRRAGLLEEWLGFGSKDALLAWAATVDCPVKGIHLYDLFIETGRGDQTERHWFDQLNYTAVAALRDE